MKKIYLHMGFHKTATSSFQSTCAKNVDKLLTQGYLYPSFKYAELKNGREVFNHSGPIVSAFGANPEAYAFNIKSKIDNFDSANKAYLDQLNDFIASDNDLIISGEGISAMGADSLQDLLTCLESKGAEVIPIVCVRSPYAFHCSSSQTVVKQGRHVNLAKLRSQKEKVLRIKTVFKDNARFIAFNTACQHSHGPVGYLLEYCGVDITDFSFETKNERRSNEYVRLQNALNKQQPSIIDKKLNTKHFQIEPVEGSNFLLNERELAAIQDKLDGENRFFRDTLGEEFCDVKIETSEDFGIEELVAAYPSLFFNRWESFKIKAESFGLYNLLLRGWRNVSSRDR